MSGFDQPQIYKETFFPPPFRIYNILNEFASYYPRKIKLKDGFYIEENNEWLCIRVSSTKSMIRIMGEGKNLRDNLNQQKEIIL